MYKDSELNELFGRLTDDGFLFFSRRAGGFFLFLFTYLSHHTSTFTHCAVAGGGGGGRTDNDKVAKLQGKMPQ